MMMRKSLRVASLAVLMGALLMVAGCKKSAESQPLPASNEIAGWEKSGETRTFTPANLSDYIDGGAEQYLKAGFKGASTSEYKFQNKIEAVADVYRMSNADAAKAIYDADPAGNASAVSLGDAARAFTQSVIFRKGPYLVRLVAYQDSPDAQRALVDLGRGIEKRISK